MSVKIHRKESDNNCHEGAFSVPLLVKVGEIFSGGGHSYILSVNHCFVTIVLTTSHVRLAIILPIVFLRLLESYPLNHITNIG